MAAAQVRFLFPVLPIFNVAAAAAVARLYNNRTKSRSWRLLWLCALAMLAASALATGVMTAASRHNYPGGHALAKLHSVEVSEAERALDEGTFLHLAAA